MATRAAQDRFALLAQAALDIERGLDLDAKLHAIVGTARAVTGARYAALGVLGADRRIARFVTAGLTREEIERIGAYPTGRGVLGVLIDDARPIRIADLGADPRSVGFPPGHPRMRSFLGVPVQARGQVFGNLYLTEARDGAFTEEDEAIVTLLATKAGIAIENARLYAEAERRAADAQRAARARESVTAVAMSILRERDVGRVMTALAEEARTLVGARTVAIGLPDEQSQTIRFPVAVGDGGAALRGRELPIDGSLAGTVLVAAAPLRVDDATVAAGAPSAGGAGDALSGALCVVPMTSGDEPIGVLAAVERHDGDAFTDEDQEVLAILAALGAIALQTARAFGRERARSEALARLRQVEAEAEARRDALRRVVDAQESERRRIAQDLHDRTAGALAAVQMGLKRLEREPDPDRLRASLAEARSDVAAAIDDVRDLIVDLRPKVLDDFGLAPALERVGDALGRRSGLAVDVAADEAVNAIEPELASAAYRIVQEALANVVRHARATRVRIAATVAGDTLIVVIEDDGIGMETRGPADERTGYGLAGMAERAALTGGRIEIAAPTGGGTRVTFEAPA